MKSSDSSFNDYDFPKTQDMIKKNNNTESEDDNYSISQTNTETSYNFDNYTLSQKYGQSNIEKGIIILLIITFLSGIIIHNNINKINRYFIYAIYISTGIDIFIILIYCFFLLKFNSEQWFNAFPIHFYYSIDYIISINFIIKFIIFCISLFFKITISSLLLFFIKLFLDIGLLMTCVKLIIFCPGYKICEEYFELIIEFMKYSMICCEKEHEEVLEYKQLYDDTTYYDIKISNEMQVI